MISSVILVLIYVFILQPIGFIISTLLYLMFQMVVLSPDDERDVKHIIRLAVINVVFTLAVFFPVPLWLQDVCGRYFYDFDYNKEDKDYAGMGLLGSAFVGILHPASILMMIAGVAIGIYIWFIPGLSASMADSADAAAYFSMTPSMGLNTLVAVYIGGISGGLISAILLNMPGTHLPLRLF